jgi:hypothetical protein
MAMKWRYEGNSIDFAGSPPGNVNFLPSRKFDLMTRAPIETHVGVNVWGATKLVPEVSRRAMTFVYKARDPKIDHFVDVKTSLRVCSSTGPHH